MPAVWLISFSVLGAVIYPVLVGLLACRSLYGSIGLLLPNDDVEKVLWSFELACSTPASATLVWNRFSLESFI